LAELDHLEMPSRAKWRAWLKKNHAASVGMWLVYPKVHTGVSTVSYDDSVREALCFGWIDGLVHAIDDEKYERRFTPRRRGSQWSDLNRRRWAELQAAGLLAPAGLAAAPTGNSYAPRPARLEVPDYLIAALKTNPSAWAAFEKLAPSHRRQYAGWIDSAKRPETREKRISEAIARLAVGEKLGLK
jgi:uncharacterized protein YdeI (YjbR/CyaY-like superfamily)